MIVTGYDISLSETPISDGISPTPLALNAECWSKTTDTSVNGVLVIINIFALIEASDVRTL